MKIYLADIRRRLGVSQNELAKLSGVTQAHINYIESGKRMPTIDVTCKLARALNVYCWDLYSCE